MASSRTVRHAFARPLRALFVGSFVVASVLTGAAPVAASPTPPPATTQGPQPTIAYPVHMDVSPALATIEPAIDDGKSVRGKDRPPKKVREDSGDVATLTSGSSSSPTSAAPTLGQSFEGVGNGFSGPSGTFTVNAAPPDPNGAVGPNHYVETVNTDFAIFNKSGTPVYGPVTINTLWSGFGGGCQSNNDGDPIVVYDRISDRWVISQFSVSTKPYLQCVAVSQTGDPTGAYFRYSYSYGNIGFPDYPKFGVWPDAYYVTFNIFNGGVTFAGAKACGYDRAKMLTGAAAAQVCFNTSTSYGGLLPSSLDGSRLPPAGAPNYMVALGTASTQLAYWQFHSDFTTPANSTFTGPTTLTVSSFSEACNGGTCIPQTGTSQQLDSLGDRLMYRLAYRNFGDHEALVVNHSVTAGSGVGLRWYELRVGAGNSLSVFQQGTYAPDANYRWMGSAAMDQSGNIGLGFSLSGSALKPAIHYTGRLATDPLGTMPQGEGTIIDGTGVQTGSNLSRWGDYTSLAVDPSDDCTFWYTGEYIASNGAFNWHTRIGTFKFSGCGTPPPANDFSISASPSSLSIQQGNSGTSTISTAVTRGTAETVTFSASGLPANASASFNPTSVTAGGSSTLTISTATSTPAGSYTVTVSGAAPSATHSTSIALTVTAPVGADPIVNGGFETGNLSGWTTAGITAISTTSHSGTYAARVGSTSPFSGDSSIAQTFTVPSGRSQLSFWYRVVCPDTVTYDWATATLKDNTTGTTATVLAKTCSNTGTWSQKTATVTAGHSYTLTLIDHDDNYPGDPTYTLYDDVTVQ